MYHIRLIDNKKKKTLIAVHNIEKVGAGYKVTDTISTTIKEEMILTSMQLLKDGKVIGYRVIPYPYSLRPGDHLDISWTFSTNRGGENVTDL